MQKQETLFVAGRTEWQTRKEQIPYPKIRSCMDYTGVERALLALGDCRSGTTSLAIVLARLGLPMGYQEDKAALRSILAGLEPETIHFGQWGKKVGSKATIGGGQLADCLMNPLKARLSGADGYGISADLLSSVLMIRNPFAALQSWKKTYANDFYQVPVETVLENFLASQYTLGEAQEDLQGLQNNGAPVTFFAQELLNYKGQETGESRKEAAMDHTAQVVHTIMSRSQMPVEMDQVYRAITNWPKVDVEEAHQVLYFPQEPPYDFKGALLPTFNSGSYRGQDQTMSNILPKLTQDEIETLYSHGLIYLYNEQLGISMQHLGVNPAQYEDLFIPHLPQILTLRESTI